MKTTVETFTYTELLKKALELGYHTIYAYGIHQYIEEALEELEEDENDDTPDWVMVGYIIFNVSDIMKEDAEIYELDY